MTTIGKYVLLFIDSYMSEQIFIQVVKLNFL